MNAVLGGWQGNWIYTAQSGLPLQWGNAYYLGNPDSLRATITGSTMTSCRAGLTAPFFCTAASEK